MGPFNLEKIPPELKARPQWVAWREETREGKKTKIPYQPRDPKQKASSTNPDTWGTFEQALNVAQTDGFHGIGYVFSVEDPYCGVDVDHCRDPKTGQLKYCAQVLSEHLASYQEVSPSGTGIHAIIKAQVPPRGNSKGLHCGSKVEMYSRGRYFTMTGHHLEETPATIELRQAELEALHSEIFGKPQVDPPKTGPGLIPDISDFALIDKAQNSTNGAKFSRLWQGDISGYDSPSEATAALCSMLAYWTDKDPGRMDRLFRQSGLMRQKWDRPQSGSTWGALEIQKAIGRTTDTYKGTRATPGLENRPKTEASKTPLSTATITTVSGPPTWPLEVMAGAAGNFSKTYAAYLETPESFLYMNYLTVLGHVISSQITLYSEINPEPRFYTVNLGESADSRKSTAILKTTKFFSGILDSEAIHEVLGVGSAEGLAKAFKRNHRVLLVADELNALIQKMRIDASVLSPCICTLFESNRFHSLTKKHEINIDSAELCILAACTLDTYRGMFTSQFLDIGLLNRFFAVIGDSKRKFAIPQPIPEHEKETLRQDLKNVLAFVDSLSRGARYAMPINSTARDIFDEWYFSLEQSVFTKRLDTYGHRLMPLLAINELQDTITPEIAEKTIVLLNYQLAARKYADPIDADNAIAKLEERIRRLLAHGPMKKRDLERAGKKSRVGIFLWNAAVKNLSGEEIVYDRSQKIYSKI